MVCRIAYVYFVSLSVKDAPSTSTTLFFHTPFPKAHKISGHNYKFACCKSCYYLSSGFSLINFVILSFGTWLNVDVILQTITCIAHFEKPLLHNRLFILKSFFPHSLPSPVCSTFVPICISFKTFVQTGNDSKTNKTHWSKYLFNHV